MIYLLDTNVLSDLIKNQRVVRQHIMVHIDEGDQLAICRPVYYEILRGLLWQNAVGQLNRFRLSILPLVEWIELVEEDWIQAAHFWADARQKGFQLGDPDLLLAAITYRIGAILVSSDSDFDALAIQHENWRA